MIKRIMLGVIFLQEEIVNNLLLSYQLNIYQLKVSIPNILS